MPPKNDNAGRSVVVWAAVSCFTAYIQPEYHCMPPPLLGSSAGYAHAQAAVVEVKLNTALFCIQCGTGGSLR